MRYAEVAVDAPWTRNRTFSYSVPDSIELKVAHSVWVPFGPRPLQGIVFDITPSPAVEDTKDVISVIDPSPLLTPAHLELARWISQRYLASLFDVTALMLPPGFRRRVLTHYCLPEGREVTVSPLTDVQRKLVSYLEHKGPCEVRMLKKALGTRGSAAAEQLFRRGIVERRSAWARPVVRPKFMTVLRLAGPKEEATSAIPTLKRNAVQQIRLMNALVETQEPIPAPELKQLGSSLAAARALEARGLVAIERVRVHRDPLKSRRYETAQPPTLTQAQEQAWSSISRALDEGRRPLAAGEGPKVFLLQGVTGSGKTELYLRALGRVVASGKRGLALVPEISLTPQTIQRFSSRFPGRVAVLHSRLSIGERFDEWWRIKGGEFDVVIGSRSTIFAPQPDLGLIVVDEEHDASYKQADPAPRYHAREVALRLAKLTGAVVILGSATPDVTSHYRAALGEFQLLELPARIRANGSAHSTSSKVADAVFPDSRLPRVEVVDLRTELREGNRSIFSRLLANSMEEALDAGEQVILFMNRRGTATFVQCRECGHSLKCRSCDVPLTYHSARERLICHHCGRKAQVPRHCSECDSSRISYLGTGTQRVEEEVVKRFPEARVLRWDRDVTRSGLSHEQILEKLLAREADVLIGTQMIAKGLHMPMVTLVGVINADVGINFPDYRAGERVFQVLTQVAGRAGRGPLGGRVVIQTFNPHHYAIESASLHDYAGFYEQEILFRRQKRFPPFKKLARLVYSHTNPNRAEGEAYRIAVRLRKERDGRGVPETDILGPAPCYLRRVRGRYRWQVILRTGDPSGFLEDIAVPEGWTVDIDPVTLL